MREKDVEKHAAFELALRDIILEKQPRNLSVDYHPDTYLHEAAVKVGWTRIDFAFPAKTHMWLEQGVVTASLGYRAPRKVVFGLERAQAVWREKLQQWVDDVDGQRTDTLANEWYADARDLPAEESFERYYGAMPV